MKRLIITLLLLMLAGLENVHALAQTPPPGAVQIRIQQPLPDATVTGSEVRVSLATTGSVALSPPGDHEWPTPGLFHVYLDEVDVLQTPLLQFSIQPIAPGPHTLRVTLEGWSGGTASPATGRFTVAPAPAPAGTWWMAGTVAVVGVVLSGGLLLLWFGWVRGAPGATDGAAEGAADDDLD